MCITHNNAYICALPINEYLNIYHALIYVHNKINVSRKIKMTNNLERMEFLPSLG